MTTVTRRGDTTYIAVPDGPGWVEHKGNVFRHTAYLTGEPGSFSAVVAGFPDVTAFGMDAESVLSRLEATMRERIAAARAAGKAVVRNETPKPAGAVEKVLIVRLA